MDAIKASGVKLVAFLASHPSATEKSSPLRELRAAFNSRFLEFVFSDQDLIEKAETILYADGPGKAEPPPNELRGASVPPELNIDQAPTKTEFPIQGKVTRKWHTGARDAELASRRMDLLAEFRKRMVDQFGLDAIRERFDKENIPDTAIYFTAGEPKSEFYRWRSGQVPNGSKTQQNIESVLNALTLPRKPKPKQPDSC